MDDINVVLESMRSDKVEKTHILKIGEVLTNLLRECEEDDDENEKIRKLADLEDYLLQMALTIDKLGGKTFSDSSAFLDHITSAVILLGTMKEDTHMRNHVILSYYRLLHIYLRLTDSSASLTQYQASITNELLKGLFEFLSNRLLTEDSFTAQESSIGILARIYFTYQKTKDKHLRTLERILPSSVKDYFKDDMKLREILKSPREFMNFLNQTNENITSANAQVLAIESNKTYENINIDGWVDIDYDELTISPISTARIVVKLSNMKDLSMSSGTGKWNAVSVSFKFKTHAGSNDFS